MRGAFARTLAELAGHDPRVLLLTGDLGYMALEPFSDRFPDRFFNVGVAEQNLVGLATGLAEAGFLPFLYSIATFASLRPYEFIRNGPVLHQFPVRVAGVGGGFEYGTAGISHYGLEDVGVMRLQPGLTVVAPADHQQARSALLATWNLAGPVYYRLGKDDRTIVPGLDGRFDPSCAEIVREGGDLLLLAMGSLAPEVVTAAEILSGKHGLEATVAVVAMLNPAPVEHLTRLCARFPLVLTAEAHYVTGGLGSLACELVAERGLGCRVVRCGVDRMPAGLSGSQAYLQAQFGLDATSLAARAVAALRPAGED